MHRMVNVFLIVCFGAISAVSMLLTPVLSDYAGRYWLFDLLVSHRIACFVYWGIFSLLGLIWKKKIFSISRASVIPALLFSVISVTEGCLKDAVSLYCPSLKALVLAFGGWFVFSCLSLELIYWRLDIILTGRKGISRQKLTARERIPGCWKMFVYGCCIILLWSPWMVMCFPGNMNWDTGTSILFHLGLDRSNVKNPFFQNLIFGMVYRLGCFLGNVDYGVFLYALCQSFLIALTLGFVLTYLERWEVPVMWIAALIALYGLCPYFPIYAITLGKDSNFTVVVLLFTSLLTVYMSQGYDFLDNWKKIGIISGLTIMMELLRNHGALIGIGCLIVCGIGFMKQTKCFPRKLGLAVTAAVLMITMLPSLLGVPETVTSESMSVPFQQTARYVMHHGDEVTPEEREAIDAVIIYEMLSEYNPVLADPVKGFARADVSNGEMLSYFKVWLKQMASHPKTYLEAFYFQTYGYYSTEAISGAKAMRKWGYDVSDSVFELTEIEPSDNWERLKLAIFLDEYAMNIPLLGKFQKIGIYTWILIAGIAYLISRKKNWRLICLLPSIVVMAGCCLSPVNGYPRYALSAVVMIPIMVSCAIFAPDMGRACE